MVAIDAPQLIKSFRQAYIDKSQNPEDAAALYDSVKDFCDKEIKPLAQKADEIGTFPRELWKKMGGLGLLGATVDPKYGGSGLSHLDHFMIMTMISEASVSIGLSYVAHSELCTNRIALNGSEKQKLKYLPGLCSGELVGALAMSEPGAGSDVMSMRTTGTSSSNEDDGVIFNGQKTWITNGGEADVIVTYGKEPELGSRKMTAVILEKNMPGFKVGRKIEKGGMKASGTYELFYDDIEVPKENILNERGKGAAVLMNGLVTERSTITGGPIGGALSSLMFTQGYISERIQGQGTPIAAKPVAAYEAAELAMDLDMAITYALEKISEFDRRPELIHNAHLPA